MKSFIGVIISLTSLISIFVFLVLTTINILFLSPKFYINSLRKPGVYQNLEKGLKISARNSLKTQLSNQGVSYDNLTTGERQIVDAEIESIISPILVNNIQDFSEKNIVRIIDYVNGKTKELIIYLPIQKWGLAKEVIDQLPNYLKSENINIQNLATDHPELNINVPQLQGFYNLGKKLKNYWLISLALVILLLFLNLIIVGPKNKFIKTGKVITLSGVITLFFAWVIRIASNTFGQNIAARSEAADILAGTIMSTLLTNVFILWLILAIVLIITGLALFNIKPRTSDSKKISP